MTDRQPVIDDDDLREFIRELEMAARDGYFEFGIHGWPGQPADIQVMGGR